MKLTEYKIREYLLENNDKFRSFYEKHKHFDRELEKISKKKEVTQEDMLNGSVLKKEKLKLKDSMERLILDFKKEGEF